MAPGYNFLTEKQVSPHVLFTLTVALPWWISSFSKENEYTGSELQQKKKKNEYWGEYGAVNVFCNDNIPLENQLGKSHEDTINENKTCRLGNSVKENSYQILILIKKYAYMCLYFIHQIVGSDWKKEYVITTSALIQGGEDFCNITPLSVFVSPTLDMEQCTAKQK